MLLTVILELTQHLWVLARVHGKLITRFLGLADVLVWGMGGVLVHEVSSEERMCASAARTSILQLYIPETTHSGSLG